MTPYELFLYCVALAAGCLILAIVAFVIVLGWWFVRGIAAGGKR